MNSKQPGFSTRAIHTGQEPEPATGAVNVPIYLSSTYVQEEIGKHKGYEYSRVSNPTRDRLETNLAALEGGVAARVFASGMAAINAVASMLKAGDHVVAGHNLYGGTPRLFNQVLVNFGLTFTYVDTSDLAAVERALQKNTRLVFLETPTNPLMELCDLHAVSDICHRHNAEVVVDNTFMSPYFQRPIELGADMVIHSTTKFLNGHSDGLGGVVVCTKNEQAEKLAFLQKAAGAIMSPFECWLILRGVKTLAVRMLQHDCNGRKVADYLSKHSKVQKVFYPGLPSHPQHELAKRQMNGFGGIVTAVLDRDLDGTRRVLERTQLFTLAESLG
ncbi:MAG: trans-sulfuration enzyme family protein, partial [Terriglobales bacterium]